MWQRLFSLPVSEGSRLRRYSGKIADVDRSQNPSSCKRFPGHFQAREHSRPCVPESTACARRVIPRMFLLYCSAKTFNEVLLKQMEVLFSLGEARKLDMYHGEPGRRDPP